MENEIEYSNAAVAELADAQDSKSCGGNLMRVRLSPAAQTQALIVQWIERRPPKLEMQVRLPLGAPNKEIVNFEVILLLTNLFS